MSRSGTDACRAASRSASPSAESVACSPSGHAKEGAVMGGVVGAPRREGPGLQVRRRRVAAQEFAGNCNLGSRRDALGPRRASARGAGPCPLGPRPGAAAVDPGPPSILVARATRWGPRARRRDRDADGALHARAAHGSPCAAPVTPTRHPAPCRPHAGSIGLGALTRARAAPRGPVAGRAHARSPPSCRGPSAPRRRRTAGPRRWIGASRGAPARRRRPRSTPTPGPA